MGLAPSQPPLISKSLVALGNCPHPPPRSAPFTTLETLVRTGGGWRRQVERGRVCPHTLGVGTGVAVPGVFLHGGLGWKFSYTKYKANLLPGGRQRSMDLFSGQRDLWCWKILWQVSFNSFLAPWDIPLSEYSGIPGWLLGTGLSNNVVGQLPSLPRGLPKPQGVVCSLGTFCTLAVGAGLWFLVLWRSPAHAIPL